MYCDKVTRKRATPHTASSSASRVGGFVRPMSISLHEQVLERIHAEYLEMPDMRLTLEQVQRLCGIERSLCQVALDSLVQAQFLCVKSNGCYARLADG